MTQTFKGQCQKRTFSTLVFLYPNGPTHVSRPLVHLLRFQLRMSLIPDYTPLHVVCQPPSVCVCVCTVEEPRAADGSDSATRILQGFWHWTRMTLARAKNNPVPGHERSFSLKRTQTDEEKWTRRTEQKDVNMCFMFLNGAARWCVFNILQPSTLLLKHLDVNETGTKATLFFVFFFVYLIFFVCVCVWLMCEPRTRIPCSFQVTDTNLCG